METPPPQHTDETSGPCAQCAHVREGRLIAHAAFPLLLHALQPGINSDHQRAADDERYALRDLQQESEEFKRTGQGEWRRPPTDRSFSYCGLDEFQQHFYACAVKNRFYECETRNKDDQICSDFIANGSRRRACKSCIYNKQPLDRIYQVLIQILSERQQGQRIRSDIDMTLQSQAASEFRQCVDSAGFVNFRPGLLPICEKYSASDGKVEQLYVVGPIANAGDSCAHWSEGANTAARDSLARLDALLDRAKRAMATPPPPAPRGLNINPTSYSDSIQQRQELQGNARADIVEYCLLELGLDSSYAASTAGVFVADVWFGRRPEGSLAAALAEIGKQGSQDGATRDASPEETQEAVTKLAKLRAEALDEVAQRREAAMAAFQPSSRTPPPPPHTEPSPQFFLVQPNTTYSHPANPGIRLVVGNNMAVVTLPDGSTIQFDLAMFPPGVWTPLLSPFGPLPVLLNVQLPSAVFACWS